jgi:hypothetical protein
LVIISSNCCNNVRNIVAWPIAFRLSFPKVWQFCYPWIYSECWNWAFLPYSFKLHVMHWKMSAIYATFITQLLLSEKQSAKFDCFSVRKMWISFLSLQVTLRLVLCPVTTSELSMVHQTCVISCSLNKIFKPVSYSESFPLIKSIIFTACFNTSIRPEGIPLMPKVHSEWNCLLKSKSIGNLQ